jgi:thymidine phosphorylase
MEDPVDPAVGFRVLVRPGMHVSRGTPLASVLARDANGLAVGEACVREAVVIGDGEVTVPALISHRVTAGGVQAL